MYNTVRVAQLVFDFNCMANLHANCFKTSVHAYSSLGLLQLHGDGTDTEIRVSTET